VWLSRPYREQAVGPIVVALKTVAKLVRLRFHLLWILAAAALVSGLMWWGGYLLISNDPLPPHAEVAVVLQGSILAEQSRLAGAVKLLRDGIVPQILVSIPKESYWGQSIAPVARDYIEKKYGPTSAARTSFCETGPEVNSTQQEAAALAQCMQEHGWHSMVLVTSDYHTRRARIIWKRILKRQNSSIEQLWVHGVPDAEFHSSGWWRDRISAKTWIMECTKLCSTLVTR
jgi:uncharacterized SAM-binding protein YcdF (DUF218 family)